jgi:hypothetical protein
VEIALVVAIALFVLMLLWRIRPLLPIATSVSAADRYVLAELKLRIEGAGGPAERAGALASAGETMARLGRRASSEGYFLRSLREAPTDAELVRRAEVALSKWPRTLENILWRRLAAAPWTGVHHAAAVAALDALCTVQEGPMRKRVSARALRHALAAVGPLVP